MAVYCQDDDMYAIFGQVAVEKWGDLDRDGAGATITAAIQAAIQWASDEINDHLRGGPVTVPFSGVGTGSGPPSIIRDICAKLAGCQLYANRGAEDFGTRGEPLDRLQGIRKEAYRKLRAVKRGRIRLEASHYDVCVSPFASGEAEDTTTDGFTVVP